jgi:hypothetical protein
MAGAFEQAWSLLKGTAGMRNEHGEAVHPAAMNYANAATMAEILDEQDKRGRYPSSYVDEGKSHLRPRLNVDERAADIVQESPYLRERGKGVTHFLMGRSYPYSDPVYGVERTPRDEVEHPNKDEENMMHTGEQQ